MKGREIWLGLGSNLGDRAAYLSRAIEDLGNHLDIVAVSSLYETAPVGGPPQGPYLNAVVKGVTPYGPFDTLDLLQGIEQRYGRQRGERFGPRTLDLDILLIGDDIIDAPRLVVPHPRMRVRRFVLYPLQELDPSLVIPPDRAAPKDLLRRLTDQTVRRIGSWDPQQRQFMVDGEGEDSQGDEKT